MLFLSLRGASRRLLSVFAAAVAAALVVPITAVGAVAAPGNPQYLALTKTVSRSELAPGDSYTYRVQVTCSEASCLDAALEDSLGELVGHDLTDVTLKASDPALTYQASWTSGGVTGANPPSVVAADTALHVAFTQSVVSPTGTGIQAGQTFTVEMTMRVPTGLAPGTDVRLNNTASVTATNSAPASASATVHVSVPETVDVSTAKTWTPAAQPFQQGAASTIALGATNASNVPVDRLTLQEPASAPEGATSLPASNPFTLVDLGTLAMTPAPAGCTAVTVDAYVLRGGVWTWLPGAGASPAAPLSLPAGVAPDEVGGLRVTCAGQVAVGATLPLSLGVVQRATDRQTGVDLSLASHQVDNVASGTAALAGHDDVTRNATASYRVTPADLGTAVTKSFSPAKVSAGESSTLSLVATQTSDVAVSELRVADLGFFTAADPRFAGFAGAPQWPTGATAARVVYHFSNGATQDVPFGAGAVPAAPTVPAGEHVTGFEVVFTGAIAPDADPARIAVTVATAERTTGGPQSVVDTATSQVTAANGNHADSTDTATLTEVPASIDVTLAKTIRPGTVLQPGDRAIVELRTSMAVSSSYVTATQLGVTDAWDGAAGGFWNAFDLTGIAPTQIPANTTVTVEVQTAVGEWHAVTVEPARAQSWLLALDSAALAAALPSGVTLQDVTGVRFALGNTGGFEENVTVVPYLETTARSTLRTGGSLPAGQTTLTNSASVHGQGTTGGGTPVEGNGGAGTGTGVQPTPPGSGPVGVAKHWSSGTVAAQSGQQRATTLTWRSRSGLQSVALTDPTDPTDVAQTVFDAFDLVDVRPIAYSSVPFSNGWYLRYDSVSDVQLYLPQGAGFAWVSVPAPSGGWMSGTGFVGYTLTAQQRADARGVRLVLQENTAARVAAHQAGAQLDPFAPAAGSGVASSATDRAFDLDWRIREVRRSATAWVTGQATYDTADPGVVRNTVQIAGTPLGGGAEVDATGSDDITIVDVTPLVAIAKTVSPAAGIYVPRPGTVPAADWPTRTFSVAAHNSSVARASYVRVSDPACSDYDVQHGCVLADPTGDPFTAGVDWLAPGSAASAFDRFDITGLSVSASVPAEVDLTKSVAWLLHTSDGTTFTTTRTTAAALASLTATDLADVVGVSVTFQGTDPTVTGGTITQSDVLRVTATTRLRTTVRSSGAPQSLRAGQSVGVENHAYAQSYDPVLAPDALAAGTDGVTVGLTGGDIDVTANKQISPAVITEPSRHAPVTVKVGATQGTSTLAPAEVRLTDDVTASPDFWDRFDLTGLGAVTMPAGADRVRADVFGPFGSGGTPTWLDGTPATATTVALPVSGADLARVQGVRFSFSRADGGFFSAAIPAPGWTADVTFTAVLRDTLRSTGAPITIVGASDHAVDNTVVAVSDRLNGETSQQKVSSAVVTLSEGTHRLGVTKLANNGDRVVDVGAPVPWDLTFTNTGTGNLTLDELRDTLPASLVWTGETAPVVTTSGPGHLPDTVAVTRDRSDLVLTWPQDGRTLSPGESVTVRLMLELQPGLTEADQAVNTMTVTTAETLDACTPLDPSRPVTGAWASNPSTCGAQDHVSPRGGPNLFTVKGVRGAMAGAATTDGQECAPLVHATGGDYYRTPCVAQSVVGGTDDWVLRVVNGGTTPVGDLTIFDPLAAVGDTMIISGADRGSVYRPQLVASSLHVNAPSGASVVTEVTTTASPCAGTWPGLTTDAVCEQHGEQWQPAGPGTDWSAVRGLRVRVDLSTSSGGALLSGQFIDVTFSTKNVLASAQAPDGVPAGPAADHVLAWNQFGVKYRDQGASQWKKIAPPKMGVELLTGPLQVRKVVDGPAAQDAPSTFAADVTCTVDGSDLQLGAAGRLALTAADGLSARIDGLPIGTACTVAEAGTLGDRGESARSGPVHLTIDSQAVDGNVPAGQVATLTNTYQPRPPTTTPGTDPVDPPAGPGRLAWTGLQVGSLLTVAVLLIVAGGVLLVVRRRSHRPTD